MGTTCSVEQEAAAGTEYGRRCISQCQQKQLSLETKRSKSTKQFKAPQLNLNPQAREALPICKKFKLNHINQIYMVQLDTKFPEDFEIKPIYSQRTARKSLHASFVTKVISEQAHNLQQLYHANRDHSDKKLNESVYTGTTRFSGRTFRQIRRPKTAVIYDDKVRELEVEI